MNNVIIEDEELTANDLADITRVIFCTVFDEYALKAYKANGIDYILKPFFRQTIEDA